MRRHGIPAAVSTVLALIGGVLINIATSNSRWPLLLSLIIFGTVWAGWETWRAIRSAGVPARAAPPPPVPLPDGTTVRNLGPRNPDFTDRDEILAGIKNLLDSQRTIVVQAIHGMGGVGKTEIANEFAHRYARDYDIIWWISAENADLVGDQIAGLGIELGLMRPETDSALATCMVMTHLNNRSGWLLVFDNAERADDLRRWIPSGPGHILITSRSGGWNNLADRVEVDVLPRAESVKLLSAHHPSLTGGEGDRLAAALGDLPLALAQAADFLAETGTGVDQYLQLLEHYVTDVLDAGHAGPYPRTLAAEVALSVERLAQSDPAAAALVSVCALLAPDAIPIDLLMPASADDLARNEFLAPLAPLAGHPVTLRQAVGQVGRYGLARVGAETLTVHRLTQAVIKHRMGDARLRELRRHVNQLLLAADPGDPDDPGTWPRWERLLPHVLAADPGRTDDARLRDLACDAVWYLLVRGNTLAGKRLSEQLYDEWSARWGRNDIHTMSAIARLARSLRDLGLYAEAKNLDADNLANRSRVLGPDHLHTLRSAHNLAVDLLEMGEAREARTIEEETYARRRDLFGEDHRHTLLSASNLARIRCVLGEVQAARELEADTLDRRRRTLGDSHRHTLDSLSNLARILRVDGETAEALRTEREAYDRWQRDFGDDHPDTLGSAFNMAEDLADLGRYDEARQFAQDTVTRRRRVLGDSHPHTLASQRQLGRILQGGNPPA